MKLYIDDAGDPSVGIFSCRWEVDVPFSKEDSDDVMREEFKEAIRSLYSAYADSKIVVCYDFEYEEECQRHQRHLAELQEEINYIYDKDNE